MATTPSHSKGLEMQMEARRSVNACFLPSSCLGYDIFAPGLMPSLPPDCGIQLSGGCWHEESHVSIVLAQFRKRGIPMLCNNYFPPPKKELTFNLASSNDKTASRSLILVEKALILCASHGIPYYSCHPGFLCDQKKNQDASLPPQSSERLPYAKALKLFLERLADLQQIGARTGIRVALENMFEPPLAFTEGRRNALNCSFEELEEIMAEVPPSLGILINLAHL